MRGPSPPLSGPGEGLARARTLHRDGKLKPAVAAYKAVLKQAPRHFEALCLMTMAQVQLGKPAEAAKTIARALALRPDSAEAHNANGNVMMALGRPEQAATAYAAARAARPGFADASLNLGNALSALGRREDALAAYRQAVAEAPDWAGAHLALATELAAAESYQAALEAIAKALALSPDMAAAHYNLGNIHKKMGDHAAACAAYRRALACDWGFAEAHNNLGTSLAALGDPEEAVSHYRRAIALRQPYAAAWCNLGNALVDLGRDAEAEEAYRRAIALDPDYFEAKGNLGQLLLSERRFAEGWRLYECRLAWIPALARIREREGLTSPRGDPRRDIQGKTILLMGEQGLGDQIMFASMIPDAVRLASAVTVTVEFRLRGLFQRSFPQCRVVGYDKAWHMLDELDPAERRYFLGSLGLIFRPRPEDFPPTPHLIADPERKEKFRARLDALGPGPKVGIMWRGGIGGITEDTRSLALADMRPLMSPDFHWISLSHLPTADEETARFEAEHGIKVHHWPEILRSDDYDDTAALLAALDAVASVTCTAAHCAAALGVETHVLAPRVAEWRYGREGSTIPWYGAMTLYRQDEAGWPLAAIRAALEARKI